MSRYPIDSPSASASANQQSWLYRAPLIITLLIAVMVIVHFGLMVLPDIAQLYAKVFGAIVPYRYFLALHQPIDPILLWLPPITYQFLHGGFMHLFLNMMFLLAFGTPVALRFINAGQISRSPAMLEGEALSPKGSQLKGSLVFLLFFLSAGIISGLVYVLLHLQVSAPLIGASGSISALMAAAIRIIIVQPSIDGPSPSNQDRSHNMAILPLNNPRLMRFGMAIIGLNVGVGILQFLFIKQGSLIAWEAHIVGYLFGLLALPFFDRIALSSGNARTG